MIKIWAQKAAIVGAKLKRLPGTPFHSKFKKERKYFAFMAGFADSILHVLRYSSGTFFSSSIYRKEPRNVTTFK